MCGARGPWPSASSTSSCSTFRNSSCSSYQAPGAALPFSLNSSTGQIMPPTPVGANLRMQLGRREHSLQAAAAVIGRSSFLKGTALFIEEKRSRRRCKRCTILLMNFLTFPATNQEKLAMGETDGKGSFGHVKAERSGLLRKPQMELKRPVFAVHEAVGLATKLVHHADSLVDPHSRSKVQVRPKKSLNRSKHLKSKLPFHATTRTGSRPRGSREVVCSEIVHAAVISLRMAWLQHRNIEDVIEYHAKHLSPRDISCMLTELQRLHDWQCTLELFKWIKKQPWHRPNSRLYTRLIGFLGREGQVDCANLLLQEMLLEKCKPDQYTFTAMLNAFGKAKRFQEAIAVFNYMKECSEPGCQPNTVTCNSLIDALSKAGMYDLAVKTFCDMRDAINGLEHGCKPNVITHNILIDALCKEGLVEVGVRVLHQMRDGDLDLRVLPNTATYNTIINACGKGGIYEKAEDLIEEMIEHGIQPDHITYTALIDAYGKAGLWESAENAFKGMKGANVSVDVMAYTAMIDAYAKEGRHEKAEELFKTMQQSGIRPNHVTYLSLINAYGKGGLPEKARSVLVGMQAGGHEGNVLIYSALIDAYGKAGCYNEAANMLGMMRLAGCSPNLITYAAVLSSCSRCNSWDGAQVLLQSFQNSEVDMERTLYKLILGDSVSQMVWEDVSRMVEEAAGQSKATQLSFCNALLGVLWSCGLCERAAHVLSLAKDTGLYIDCTIFTNSEWCLDLHRTLRNIQGYQEPSLVSCLSELLPVRPRLSVGAAITMLITWLEEIHLALIWGEDTPETVIVVIGKGNHSKSKSSALKAPVELQLAQLGSPFTSLPSNWGRVTAAGGAVQAWILSPGIKQRLSLVDAVKPHSSYNKASEG